MLHVFYLYQVQLVVYNYIFVYISFYAPYMREVS